MKQFPFLILGGLLILAACNLPGGSAAPGQGSRQTLEPLSTPLPTDSLPAALLPTPNLPVISPAALVWIDFLDPQDGWGLSQDGNGKVLRSMDGGLSWFDVTPVGEGSLDYSSRLTVLDDRTAWLLVPDPDFSTGRLYHTSDGGLSWNSNPVPFGGGSLQFLDASTGRMLADRGAGAGSQAVELYQTSDGGESWVSVFHNDPTQDGSSDSLPLSGIKDGMTFVDANIGFVAGSRPMPGDIYLFFTRDGGSTWVQQTLPLPAGYETYQYVTSAPLFFGTDGILPLLVYPLSGSPERTFFTSSDGGTSWSGNPNDASQVIAPGNYSFSDASHGHSWDGSADLYFTSDGARSWGGLAVSQDLGGFPLQLDFVDAATGWVLINPADDSYRLYLTMDGGGTWTPLTP